MKRSVNKKRSRRYNEDCKRQVFGFSQPVGRFKFCWPQSERRLILWTPMRPAVRTGGASLRRVAPFFLKNTTDHKDVDSRQPLAENVVSSLHLESRFYAVFSKAA